MFFLLIFSRWWTILFHFPVLLDLCFEFKNALYSLKKSVFPLRPGCLALRCPLPWDNVKGYGDLSIWKGPESQFCLNSQMQGSAVIFWISLNGWKWVDWERPLVCVTVFLPVMLALKLQLLRFYISAHVTETICNVCFNSYCWRFPWCFVLAPWGYGEWWWPVSQTQFSAWQWWLQRHSCHSSTFGLYPDQRNVDQFRYTEVDGIFHHKSCITGNTEGSNSAWNKRTKIIHNYE